MQGRSVHVTGRDLETRLLTAAREAFHLPFDAASITPQITALYERRAAPLKRAQARGNAKPSGNSRN
ncbi:hypothetical protein [Deinococcus multiflagellatus]|uniref:Uncharacterized protein n=1 Tax=Deinococcus multiflagellatus TaxID=1656887 RepID=A0ABW1ZPN7_9DEIO